MRAPIAAETQRMQSDLARTTATAGLRSAAQEALAPWVDGHAECALLDFQNHGNVGDSAIWLGALAWLERIGCRIRHVCSERDYDPRPLRRVLGDRPILLSGGGNLGDLWPAFQRFRERVLADFPDRRILQLPQSIHFTRAENAERARAAFTAHPDFHLFVRDRASLELARGQLGITARLCPDMVHMLDMSAFAEPKRHRLLVLSRADQEKLPISEQALKRARRTDCLIADWVEQPRLPEEKLYRRARRLVRARWLPGGPFERRALHYTRLLASQRVHWGSALLGSARAIVTDRLHAALLGRLGGTRVYFVDNSYGKLSAYAGTWFAEDPELVACKGFKEALQRADEEVRCG
jgi:exopolysaccharide biosynthesis predicted pyruvyltransferase EpsI